MIAALDASFRKKSGKHTSGLGAFWFGSIGRVEKGRELSLLSILGVKFNTDFATLSNKR